MTSRGGGEPLYDDAEVGRSETSSEGEEDSQGTQSFGYDDDSCGDTESAAVVDHAAAASSFESAELLTDLGFLQARRRLVLPGLALEDGEVDVERSAALAVMDRFGFLLVSCSTGGFPVGRDRVGTCIAYSVAWRSWGC